MNPCLAPMGESLASRLRHIAMAVHRHDGFIGGLPAGACAASPTAGAPDPIVRPLPHEREPVGPELAREFVLRMLGVAASPRGADLLRALAGRELSTAQLAESLARPRLTVWEQVNDLVQVGLAARDGLDDKVGLTAAGSCMNELIDELVGHVTGAPA